MLFGFCITLRVYELDEESINHPPIDHKLFCLCIFLHLIDQFSCCLHYFSLLLINQKILLLNLLVWQLQLYDLGFQIFNHTHLGFSLFNLALKWFDSLFVLIQLGFASIDKLVVLFTDLLQCPQQIFDSLVDFKQFCLFASELGFLPLNVLLNFSYLLSVFFQCAILCLLVLKLSLQSFILFITLLQFIIQNLRRRYEIFHLIGLILKTQFAH